MDSLSNNHDFSTEVLFFFNRRLLFHSYEKDFFNGENLESKTELFFPTKLIELLDNASDAKKLHSYSKSIKVICVLSVRSIQKAL